MLSITFIAGNLFYHKVPFKTFLTLSKISCLLKNTSFKTKLFASMSVNV